MQLLTSITGSSKISVPMTIVASGIAKMFVGELVETGLRAVKLHSPKFVIWFGIFVS